MRYEHARSGFIRDPLSILAALDYVYDIAGILILDKSKGGLYTSFDRGKWDVMSIELFKYLT